MRRDAHRDEYQSLLLGQVLLFGLLGASLALFASNASLRDVYELPELRLVIGTAVMLAAAVVAILAGVRFSVEGRLLDLLLCCGFSVATLSDLAFEIAPTMGGNAVDSREAWADIGGRLLAAVLIAVAPLARGRVTSRDRALRTALGACAVALAALWGLSDALLPALPELRPDEARDAPSLLTLSLALNALLSLAAVIGFTWRYKSHGEDLDRWLSLGVTFLLFASLHLLFTPLVSSEYVSQGDFLRVIAYGLLLVGVWRAIRSAEFGRAVAEERARVAREIHDGLAQYLFAVSTHAAMLESGAPAETTLPHLRQAALAAQQEARFAVLALSSASGTAPFDAALRRYVEFLTADGALEVDLEIDAGIRLAADEQIEVFRIVQEGLGNIRKHAGANRAEVRIEERAGRRVVTVRDDGAGFDGQERDAGQGLKNIRARAASIDGSFTLRSRPGFGTLLEVTLRA
ncbi:MAG: histidine kinase [Actinomycetota bacterium]|nr:histidine kinase [Actinomycetota bacterium]